MPPAPELTIAIPIGPGYEQYVERSVESVKSQTIPVVGISFVDERGKGPGFARNQLALRCETPYIAFLDCGDWLEADYAADMLSAIKMSKGRYVYCGWYGGKSPEEPFEEVPMIPSERCYCFDNNWQVHLVTAVFPVLWMRQVGGFNETLPGMEDTDFFHKLNEAGHCGQLVPKPLIHYSTVNQRSIDFQKRADVEQIKAEIERRYHKPVMNCCGRQAVVNQGPFNEKQPGDILAEIVGAAFIVYVGKGSGRVYPPGMSPGQRCWADPQDVHNDPHHFRAVPMAEWPSLQSSADIGDFMQAQRNNVHLPQANGIPKPPAAPITAERLRQLARFGNDE